MACVPQIAFLLLVSLHFAQAQHHPNAKERQDARIAAFARESRINQETKTLTALVSPYLGEYPQAEAIVRYMSAFHDGNVLSVNATIPKGVRSRYREMSLPSVMNMLTKINAKPGMKFYELGTGSGKTALMAKLLGLDVSSIETDRALYDRTCSKQLGATEAPINGQGKLQLAYGRNFTIDFTDADILYVDSADFSPKTMEDLAHIVRHMRPGSKVVSATPVPGLARGKRMPERMLTRDGEHSANFFYQKVLSNDFNSGKIGTTIDSFLARRGYAKGYSLDFCGESAEAKESRKPVPAPTRAQLWKQQEKLRGEARKKAAERKAAMKAEKKKAKKGKKRSLLSRFR